MSNVHSWYVADELTKPENRCERGSDVAFGRQMIMLPL